MTALVAACGGTSTGKGDGGPACVSQCEKAKAADCPWAKAIANCDDDCLTEDAKLESTGCRASYDETLACSTDLDDICAFPTACKSALVDYNACTLEYCEDHEASFCP